MSKVGAANYTYNPAVFDVGSLEAAKRIILTPDNNQSTHARWAKETPYLVDLISQMPLTQDSVILDFGCGVGRLSKALIEKHGCRCVGVDISASMRALANAYVNSPRFFSCAPEALPWLGVKFDGALAIWVLQHCQNVEDDIGAIKASLKDTGWLFVVNDQKRIVPTREAGWQNDDKDVKSLLDAELSSNIVGELDPAFIGPDLASVSYWATWAR